MEDKDWGDPEVLSGGRYIRFYTVTKRWYLYDKKGNLITSNKNKENLKKFRGR